MFGKQKNAPVKMGDWLVVNDENGISNYTKIIELAKKQEIIAKADKYIQMWRMYFTTTPPKKSSVVEMCTTTKGRTLTLDCNEFGVACMYYTKYYQSWNGMTEINVLAIE